MQVGGFFPQYLYGCEGGSQRVKAGAQVGGDGNLRKVTGRDGFADADKLCGVLLVDGFVLVMVRACKKRINAGNGFALRIHSTLDSLDVGAQQVFDLGFEACWRDVCCIVLGCVCKPAAGGQKLRFLWGQDDLAYRVLMP